MTVVHSEERIKKAIRDRYGDIARRVAGEDAGPGRTSAGCCGTQDNVDERRAQESCCDPAQVAADSRTRQCCESSESVAECCPTAERLYSAEELAGLPDSVSDASLGCGSPTAIAELQPGETVLDLGSGGGIDCFLAAKQVGPEGQAIGLDMTTDMIKLARRNAKKMGLANVDFRYGEMEDMPLPDESVDVIISNCVVNLSPDKDAVFREAYRVLRPGGRMSISDIVIDGALPQAIRGRLDAWADCVAGALDEQVYLGKMRAAGFERVEVESREGFPLDELREEVAEVSPAELAGTVVSIRVRAHK